MAVRLSNPWDPLGRLGQNIGQNISRAPKAENLMVFEGLVNDVN